MKIHAHPTLPFITVLLLASLALLTGCSDDDPVAVGAGDPDPVVAADLASAARTAGLIGENLDQSDLFANPLSSLAEDADLYQEAEFDGWEGDGMSWPEKSARLADGYRDLIDLDRVAASAVKSKSRFVAMAPRALKYEGEPGDTLSVEYFDGPDSTGVNALILVEAPSLVRFVSERDYPRILGRAVRVDQEILLDTNDTDEDGEDDVIHSLRHEREMFGGEVATGVIQPEDGPGPITSETIVLASYHVVEPRFHLLQAWTHCEIRTTLGDLDVDGDEALYSLEAVVHWRSDAEHRVEAAASDGGSVGPDTVVEIEAVFTAAPHNGWLESIADTLTACLGDLDEEDDDELLSLARTTVFDGVASDGGNPRTTISFTPDEPVSPGDEPCGGEAVKEAWYPAAWWLVHLNEDADIECDGSGVYRQRLEYRDGTVVERTVTWDGAGGATITENRPDGTVVTGTWDEASGAYSLQTVFPEGSDPVSRLQNGVAHDGELEAWDVFTWQDGRTDSTYVHLTGDDDRFSVEGYTVKGDVREDFTLDADGEDHLTGTWSRSDGAGGRFDLEAVEGGGAHLVFSAADPSADGEPSVEGEVWFAPDGSGTGTITFTQYGQTVTMEIEFGPDGDGTLEDHLGGLHPLI